MNIRLMLLMAALMVIVVIAFWPDLPEAAVRPAAPMPLNVAASAPAPTAVAQLNPAPKTKAAPGTQACETTQVSGSHTARFEWEARQGALEDVADVCPAGKVSPTQLNCTPVDGRHGIMGDAAIKCVQQAACTLCGEVLARKREVAQSAHLR